MSQIDQDIEEEEAENAIAIGTFLQRNKVPYVTDIAVTMTYRDDIVGMLTGYTVKLNIRSFDQHKGVFDADKRTADPDDIVQTIEQIGSMMFPTQAPQDIPDMTLVVIEHIEIDEEFRGLGFSGRLIRETKDIFASETTFALLKASREHIRENRTFDDLVTYLCIGTEADFQPLGSDDWLVAFWDVAGNIEGDVRSILFVDDAGEAVNFNSKSPV